MEMKNRLSFLENISISVEHKNKAAIALQENACSLIWRNKIRKPGKCGQLMHYFTENL
jgi:hypothetical protein